MMVQWELWAKLDFFCYASPFVDNSVFKSFSLFFACVFFWLYTNVMFSNFILIYNSLISSINGHKCIGFWLFRGLSTALNRASIRTDYCWCCVTVDVPSNYLSMTMLCWINIEVLFPLFYMLDKKQHALYQWYNIN